MGRAQRRTSLYIVLLLSLTVPAAASLPFADGFENITPGDYPDENGWQVMFSGVSAYVTNVPAHTGDNSFRLESQGGWARHDYIQLCDIPDRLSYEAAVCIAPSGQQEASVGFLTAHGSQGPTWNKIRINDAGNGLVEFCGVEDFALASYTAGTWYVVRVDLDYTTLTADAWLNGTRVVEGVDIYPPEFESGHGHEVLDRFGLVAGGSGTVAYFDDIVVEATPDTTCTVWQELAPMHYARSEAGVIAFDGKVWIFGGRDFGLPEVWHDTVEVYDPATDTWTMKAPMPEPRAGATAAAYDGKIYVFGGQIGAPKYRNTWVYDPGDDTWSAAHRRLRRVHASGEQSRHLRPGHGHLA
jgi:hypothetical protein